MNKDKLQVCISFKHTKDEEELYTYVIGQNDKSVFIKNLIRNHLSGYIQNTTVVESKIESNDIVEKKLSHGKQTRNKFLV